MLEIELYEEVSEELTSGRCIWDSAWLESGMARSAPADQISGACQCDDVFAGERKSNTKRRDHQETLENHVWITGCEFAKAKTWSRNIVRRSVDNAVCWIQRDRRLVGGVSWSHNSKIVNSSWSGDVGVHEICGNPVPILSSLLLMTPPDLLGRSC